MTGTYDEVINSRERLREIIGEPGPAIVGKVIDHVDEICARYIAASPFCVIATRGADGLLDQSPKGDPAGFVTVRDRKTLIIPDRPGNKRADSFENLLVNPEVAIIFLIPGYGYTLRVSGTAKIVRDATLAEQLVVNGRPPNLLLVMTVDEAYMHCAKAMARSKIWDQQAWPDSTQVPTLAEAMVAHGRLARTEREQQAFIDKDFETRMY
jgi:PPOX class probable FMN-dependent enzyme